MKKLRIILSSIFVATLTVSGLSLLLPSPKDAEVKQYYSPIATSVVLVDVMLAWGSAVLFLLALRNFKPELKRAYTLMALSTVAVGAGLLIFPYIEYYGLWDNLGFNMASYLQYLVGAPLMYFGVRMFYKRLGLNGKEASLIAVLIGIAILSLIHPFLPYDGAWPLPLWGYNLFKVVTIIPFVLYGAAGIMAFRIRRRVGAEYRMAFTWMVIALGFYVINTLGIILIEIVGYNNPYYDERIYTVPAILGDLCLVLAGYAFATIGMPKTSAKEHVSSIDIIVYVAGMASDQSKIDPLLDNMRMITAHLQPQQVLSDTEQATLKQTYLGIEKFLVTSDPLRDFDRDTLRLDVSRHFALDKQPQATFWPTLD